MEKAQLQLNDTVGVDDVIALHALIDRISERSTMTPATTGTQHERHRIPIRRLDDSARRRRHLRADHGDPADDGPVLADVNTATGLGIANISLAFAFGQLWWGSRSRSPAQFSDRIGAGRVLLIGVSLVALGTILTPLMTSTAGLIFAIGVLAAGGAGMAGPIGADGSDDHACCRQKDAEWPPASSTPAVHSGQFVAGAVAAS